jgi:excisionase family DNA binding protein
MTALPAALTIPAAAEYLSVSRATIYRLFERGDLPLIKIAGRTLIRRGDIEALLDRSTITDLSQTGQGRPRKAVEPAAIFA